MTDVPVVPHEAEAFCAQCGANLGAKGFGIDADPDVRLVCPIHGDQGSLRDFRRQAIEKFRDDLQELTDQKVKEISRAIGPGAFDKP